ncbi:MAG: MHS family MFS transporter [Bacteroidetes Order II. Incertae sedis bacterium]|nr:MHS family MFS transporter [Bacteroidetes Order II. bacterium]
MSSSPHSRQGISTVIGASSVGTLIEWYDFYIFGSLAAIISTQFFPKGNPTAALLSALAVFAAGFVVRPFGALVFGRLGDIVGRKYTFLVTLVLMGGSTFLIGLVPGYESIGMAAPIIVLVLRLIQGLALGGEYGGAATYVAEHAPVGKRGLYTSWIQTTATLGLFLSLGVILTCRNALGVEAFEDWGWRIPFWISILLVGVSIYIRLKMAESPAFTKIKAEGKISTNPLKESFTKKENMKMVLLALLGAVMGQGVVWYTGQFYALSFMQNTMALDTAQASWILIYALAFGTGFFVLFGWLSDKIGRKWIMMAGMLLAIISYRPIYTMMYDTADLTKKTVVEGSEKTDVTNSTAENGNKVEKKVVTRSYTDGTKFKETTTTTTPAGSTTAEKPVVKKAITLPSGQQWTLIFLILIQVIYVTMVYGPIAAFLVELFPTRIRYTSMSLPYHIGNGIFGGLMPFIGTALVTQAKTAGTPMPYLAGLWYPIIIAGVCLVIGALYLSNKAVDEE